MSEHEHRALHHPRIIEFHKFYSEFNVLFDAGGEGYRVSFRIYETGDKRFFFEQSHFIATPLTDGRPADGRTLHDEPHLALGAGVASITTYYEEAVAAGHAPSPEWFVRNAVY